MIKLDITDQRPFAGGHAFGETGTYERLSGRALFAVDPLAPAQADVVEQGTQVSRSPSRVRMAPGASDSKPLMLPLSGLFVDPVHRKSIDQCRRRIKTREQQLMTDEPAPRRRDSSFAVGVHHGPGGHVDDSTHR